MATEDVFIGRQPILDQHQALVAYELLFRSGSKQNTANVQDDLAATASVISHAFADLGIEQALGPYKGFINCDESLLLSDMPAIIAGRKLGHSQLALVRLLGLVLEDAETGDLEGVLKHEPGLTMNLMRLTNSAATGVRTKVTSLRHAITVLGRGRLMPWSARWERLTRKPPTPASPRR